MDQTEPKNVPPEFLWGLDPMFRSCNKMYIKDVLNMPPMPNYKGVYSYKSHPVMKVDLVGVIVSVVHRNKFWVYAIDDGTGVINCACWKPHAISKFCDVNEISNDLGAALAGMIGKVEILNIAAEDGFHLGDLLQVKGRIKLFFDTREISAFSFQVVEDPSYEIYRLLELPRIYTSVYDQQLKLPDKVAHGLTAEGQHSANMASDQLYFEQELWMLIERESLLNCSSRILSKLMQTLLTKTQGNIKLAMDSYIQRGMLYHAASDQSYTHVVTKLDEALANNVLKILKSRCAASRDDMGCHMIKVLEELRKLEAYANISKSSLLLVLDKLECESLIISTSDKHFIPFDF